jgi:hypothetical protein
MPSEDRCWQIHQLLSDLGSFIDPNQELPSNGVYFFYEDGEFCERDGVRLERIVRVGTHREQGNLQRRLHYHYYGDKNGSVFRKHIGGAILAQADPSDPRLSTWLAQDTPTFAEVEDQVNEIIRNRFRFRCTRVNDANERLTLEECLIGALSGCLHCRPSTSWLGRFARDEKIRFSGLWNSQHTDSLLHLKEADWFTRFQKAVERTKAGGDDKMKTSSKSTVDWGRINERIARCKNLPEQVRLNCLKELYQETKDGMAAYALGQESENQNALGEALECYMAAQSKFPQPQWKQNAVEAITRVESKLRHHESLETTGKLATPDVLVVVCCTKRKIWNEVTHPPGRFYVPAQFAYRGPEFQRWMAEDRFAAERIAEGFRWVILSAKYGFIEPMHPIGNYDVAFEDENGLPLNGPITEDSLHAQATRQTRQWEDGFEAKLSDFGKVVLYGNCRRKYAEYITRIFGSKVVSWSEFTKDLTG